MPTPFPGMDPYLERRGLWEQVHTALIVDIQKYLARLLRPRYRVEVEKRVYLAVWPFEENKLASTPDLPSKEAERFDRVTISPSIGMMPHVAELPMADEVVERDLKVCDMATGEVITVIELLSLGNKQTPQGREQYEQKRLQALASVTNLVEIDLLRAGEAQPFRLRDAHIESDYRIIVSRAAYRPQADVYMFGVRRPIPEIPIPLRPGESEPILPLNKLLHDLYDDVGYDLSIDYRKPPVPRLTGEDAKWAKQLLHDFFEW